MFKKWLARVAGAGLFLAAVGLTPAPAQATSIPSLDHVFVIVMENELYGNIIGSSAAPYINSLASSGGLANDYFGVAHPSLPNYLALTGASTFGISTDCTTCWVASSNIADSLETAGRSWKAYEESMPSACFVGDSYPYMQKHDPFIYYNDIRTNTSRCQSHVVPYTQLATDLQTTATTPNYAFITPNMCDDMHDCTVATGDSWLQQQVPEILNSPAFTTQHSLLAVTWDESDSSTTNQVPLILLGSGITAGFASSAAYDHYSLLHTIESALGVGALNQSTDASAPLMTDFFTSVPPPSPSPSPSPTSQPPVVYTPVAPTRLLDTRSTHNTLANQGSLNLAIGGVTVPANATAVVLNVTAVDETAAGAFIVFPSGGTVPLASNLNWARGETVANLVTVGLGTGGQITIFNIAGTADAVVDLAGYYAPTAGGSAGEFVPVVPSRLTDTRTGSGEPNAGSTFGPGTTVNVQVTGVGGVPAAGVSAVVLNLTATDTTTAGFFTVYPAGGSAPLASNVNWNAGTTVPNRVAVEVGTGGKVSVYNGLGRADAIVDVNGYFTDSTASGASFTPVSPSRILDTRVAGGPFSAPLGAGATIAVPVAGAGGVPGMSSGMVPQAVVINVTVTNPTTASDLIVWPDATGRPLSSDLNYVNGQTVPNLVVVKLSAAGKIDIFNQFGSTNVIIDVVGWYG